MVAQLMPALIIVPVGLGVMNDGPRPTRCDNIHPDTRQSAGRHQPECQHGKYDHRQAAAIGRLTAPGSAHLAIGSVSARPRLDRVRAGVGLDGDGLLGVDRRKRGSGIGPRCGSSRHRSSRRALVCDEVLACAAGTSGNAGAAFPFGGPCRTSSSVVAPTTGAGFGLTARILMCGEDGALPPGVIDVGAVADLAAAIGPDCAGVEFDGAAAADVAGAAACCAGWPGARKYQHLR